MEGLQAQHNPLAAMALWPWLPCALQSLQLGELQWQIELTAKLSYLFTAVNSKFSSTVCVFQVRRYAYNTPALCLLCTLHGNEMYNRSAWKSAMFCRTARYVS